MAEGCLVKPIPHYLMRALQGHRRPHVAFLAHRFLERLGDETRSSVSLPGDQIPRDALPSWGLEGTGLGTLSVEGHPTGHGLCHVARGLSELPEAMSLVPMPPGRGGGRPGAHPFLEPQTGVLHTRDWTEGPCTSER